MQQTTNPHAPVSSHESNVFDQTPASTCRYAKTYTGGGVSPPPPYGVPEKHGHPAMMMPPLQMGLPALVAQPAVTGSDDGGSMHTVPIQLSDGCTPEDGLQPHSTVSSDAGKFSLLKGVENKVLCHLLSVKMCRGCTELATCANAAD